MAVVDSCTDFDACLSLPGRKLGGVEDVNNLHSLAVNAIHNTIRNFDQLPHSGPPVPIDPAPKAREFSKMVATLQDTVDHAVCDVR